MYLEAQAVSLFTISQRPSLRAATFVATVQRRAHCACFSNSCKCFSLLGCQMSAVFLNVDVIATACWGVRHYAGQARVDQSSEANRTIRTLAARPRLHDSHCCTRFHARYTLGLWPTRLVLFAAATLCVFKLSLLRCGIDVGWFLLDIGDSFEAALKLFSIQQ